MIGSGNVLTSSLYKSTVSLYTTYLEFIRSSTLVIKILLTAITGIIPAVQSEVLVYLSCKTFILCG